MCACLLFLVMLELHLAYSFSPTHNILETRSPFNMLRMAESDGFNMDSLRKRMERQENQYVKLLKEQSRYTSHEFQLPEFVHIILFLPDTLQQNVHTIEIPKGSGNNVLLAFEGGEDCVLFAELLKDLEFVDPCPEGTEFEPLAQYCDSIWMPFVIVLSGFQLMPPQINSNGECEYDDEIDLSIDTAENDSSWKTKSNSNNVELDS